MKSSAVVFAMAPMVLGFICATSSVADTLHFEGFEDPSWTPGQAGNWQIYLDGTIQRVTSGTNGITSSSGSAHAILGQAVPNPASAPYTSFGSYRTSFGGGFVAGLDIYLDPSWSDGAGFDYSVGATRQNGDHLRDFIWHVGTHNGNLLINASFNTDFGFNASKLTSGPNYQVQSAGWYTFEQVFHDASGVLAVDMNLRDSNGNLLFTKTLSHPPDLISTVVGGNRYGWFTYNNIDGLAIDNTSLMSVVPLPAAAWGGMALMGILGVKRLRKGATLEA
jgi:hypothetical protein